MTTNPLTLAAVRAIRLLTYEMLDAVQERNIIERDVPALCDTIETLVEALRWVEARLVKSTVTAPKIRELLATIDLPSAEAQTKGDGG